MPDALRPFLIGTAGHVDHGKTALVQALTGTNTDRLEEEQRRGMSIDLGFAEFKLPSGRKAGIVDVPGHERFLKNMLAGASGVDFALLIVAADEGVMPQTTEHLAVLQALHIQRGLTVLTKADTVDAEWLDLVSAEVFKVLKGTFLEHSARVAVDSLSRTGLDELLKLLEESAAEMASPSISAPVYLPIDRVFQRPGFGTIVTGSLRSGTLREGDSVAVYPSGRTGRVRGLQTFGHNEAEAHAGMRTAVNLAGVDVDDLKRGDVLAPVGGLTASERMNVRLELNEGARSLKHRARVRVHVGTAEVLARVLLWESPEMQPGTAAMAQLHFERPHVARRGDRFVVRSYSPQEVMGGGTVLEPVAEPFRTREPGIIARLQTLDKGDPNEIVSEALRTSGAIPLSTEQLAQQTGLAAADVQVALQSKLSDGDVRETRAGYISDHAYGAARRRWAGRLAAFHKKAPLRPGMPKSELRGQETPSLSQAAFDALASEMAADGAVVVERDLVRLPDFTVNLRPDQQATVSEILNEYQRGGWQPPGEWEIVKNLGPHRATREIWEFLTGSGQLLLLGDGLYIHRGILTQGLAAVSAHLAKGEPLTAGTFRDLTGSTRRTAVPFLEWCDTQRITRRVGDARIAGPKLEDATVTFDRRETSIE